MKPVLQCAECLFTLPEAAPADHDSACPRCGAPLHDRLPQSLQRSTAFALAGLFLLVPANVLPVLTSNLLGDVQTNTILSGVRALYDDGLWGIALIVFAASVLVPVLKLAGLGILLHAARRGATRRRGLTQLYGFIRFIGRWSMLDVFLVAFLAGAVQFGRLATVTPEPGIIAFAAAVILTVCATETFDPRLLWDERAQTS